MHKMLCRFGCMNASSPAKQVNSFMMDGIDPYQSPNASCSQEDAAISKGSYSAERCPNCLAEVTFWTALKQATPFRFKCPRCGSRCRVRTAFMPLIFVGVSCGALLGVLAVGLGAMVFGFMVLLPAVPLLVAAWIALEVWTFLYIKRRGRFVLMRTGEQLHAPEPAAGSVSNGSLP